MGPGNIEILQGERLLAHYSGTVVDRIPHPKLRHGAMESDLGWHAGSNRFPGCVALGKGINISDPWFLCR